MLISIVTPIYNRAHLIKKLYHSLLQQQKYNFEWIIIDDGSTDNLDELIYSFQKKSPFEIVYQKKTNGGKHTAINESVKLSSTDWIFIVDSDDIITPTATEIIEHNLLKIHDPKCCGLIFLKKNTQGDLCGNLLAKEKINNIELANTIGDKAIVLNKTLLLENPFPVFKNEKFLTEAYVWNKALDYKYLLSINEVIYICEYLDDGLTNNYYKLLKNNINGTLAFVISNLNLKSNSIGIYKQSIYHFYPIISARSLITVFKGTTKKRFLIFITLLTLFFIKRLLRDKT
ncbi:TPA: glycosyltransferase family 2 protein [Morganella morganii]|nr:glycosyltransferase family 2 protein [Morganella morganii]HDF2423481.1 glycosyltransferase family 2 protein [Morganella morganii]